MLTITAGEDATIAVPFERGGEPFVPDENTVTWSLRDHNGIAVGGSPSVNHGGESYILVTVPGTSNTVASGRRFEKRFVVVKGEVGGQPFTTQVAYRVAPWLNTTATLADVRSFIGTDAGELPDSDIDLVDAYFLLADAVGPDALEEALASGTIDEQVANKAIVGQAVINVLPGLRQRLLKKESDGTQSGERFDIDFEKLGHLAYGAVEAALRQFGGLDDTVAYRTLFIVATPSPDPVTGA